MKRERMFPTKSRIQVAIALERLAEVSFSLSNRGLAYSAYKRLKEADYLSLISMLCFARFFALLRPVLNERSANYYDRLKSKHLPQRTQTILAIRGWRKHYPELLAKKGD